MSRESTRALLCTELTGERGCLWPSELVSVSPQTRRTGLPGDENGWGQVRGALGRDEPLVCSDLSAWLLWVGSAQDGERSSHLALLTLHLQPCLPPRGGATWVLSKNVCPLGPQHGFCCVCGRSLGEVLSWAGLPSSRVPQGWLPQPCPHTAPREAGKGQALLQKSCSCLHPLLCSHLAWCLRRNLPHKQPHPRTYPEQLMRAEGNPGKPVWGLGGTFPTSQVCPHSFLFQFSCPPPCFLQGIRCGHGFALPPQQCLQVRKNRVGCFTSTVRWSQCRLFVN